MTRYAVAYDDATLAAKLYEQGRLSFGQAARLAGMGRAEFLLALKHVGVSAINLTEEDRRDDLAHA